MIEDDGNNILPNFTNLQVRSLFVITAERRGLHSSSISPTPGLSQAYMQTICSLQSLLVLEIDGHIEYLPDEVADLVRLRYLALFDSNLNKLPQTLGNLQKLQTLDLMCGNLRELPIEVLTIQNLRHLLMSRSIRVPKEIGKLTNLYTCSGVYAGGGIASELSRLTQLRELSVKRVSEDHASELCAAIMKMENLLSVKLEAEINCYSIDQMYTFLPEFELFSPPSLLQEVYLCGVLVEIPIWLFSMSNLTRLELHFSDLTETPTTDIQFLPNLKHLTLWQAYKAKLLGKEFCQAGGFPALQTLTIDSMFLEHWTEIVNGAFPSLKSLTLRCTRLRFLPEGLQNISTLEELFLTTVHGDLARRLKSTENYKIKHILKLGAYFEGGKFIYVGSPEEVLQHA
uniref:Disease resistance R13L4/SHOC-2-like LRR domain-containing protein n=1 Tax=Manihot esculenta TaxID=3983 RepID=A0A2C9UUC8_MANES